MLLEPGFPFPSALLPVLASFSMFFLVVDQIATSSSGMVGFFKSVHKIRQE